MLDHFTRHPRTVGETYGEHMGMAWSFGSDMIIAGAACLIHGLFPFLFETTASRAVARLDKRMRRETPPADAAQQHSATP